jgi:ribosomal-protein-alanine N-acetyltransferase
MPIREMKESDLPQVLEIQKALGFQEWNEREFLAEIRASYALCVVFEQGNNITGYAIFHLMGPDSELLSIATSAEEQGKGIGSALLDAGLARLDFTGGDRMFLEVREGNEKARRFYEHHGFESYAKREKYYSDGETAVLYRKA